MRYLLIPDVHESILWKESVKNEKYDEVIFLGDYIDDWNSSKHWSSNEWNPIINIENIIDFKKKSNKKVTLLLGNHDMSYLLEDDSVSGHQNKYAYDIKKVFEDNLKEFDIVYQSNNLVFSHAGISNEWFDDTVEKYENFDKSCMNSITYLNNLLHNKQYYPFGFIIKKFSYDYSGDNTWQSCTWIRPNSLIRDMKFDNQVIGHTELVVKNYPFNIIQNNLEHLNESYKDKNLYMCDSRSHQPCILEL